MSIVILISTLIFVFIISFSKTRLKGSAALAAVLINASLSSYMAFNAITGSSFEERYDGGYVFQDIAVRIDALSGWFILMMNFTMLTGIYYGRHYMKRYENHSAENLSLHFAGYVVIHCAMLGIFCVQNSLAFLCVWETMAIASFLLIIFEHHKIDTLKAGINYLVQAHIGIMFMMIGFIWISSYTHSYDFHSIEQYCATVGGSIRYLLFLCFFVAFAIKAGFVPFHTWLPYAHPAAPSHVSGVMSGVIIKLGIFGILRMLLLIKGSYLTIGYTILVISVISAVYGVTLAIVQHNLKKLLAYHSIENIGIIGIGIGLGSIGLGLNNYYLSFAGFAGALLHTLNHSLFKSLLFYCAGTVYQATHTMEIEHLGGLIKRMPRTATLFLIAALAICGLPPFNGFISEFFIYSGLFAGVRLNQFTPAIIMIVSIFGLVLVGGLALLCFTKAFGIVFLGKARRPYTEQDLIEIEDVATLFPKYLIALIIITIGVVPQVAIWIIAQPVGLFMGTMSADVQVMEFVPVFQKISICGFGLIVLSMAIVWIRKIVSVSKEVTIGPTWGCGYPAPTSKFQYTANSYVRSYRKLIRPLLLMNKKETEMQGVFPNPVRSATTPYDKMEAVFIDVPLKYLRAFLGKFRFLQNGNLQFYVLYGVAFIFLVIFIPLIIDGARYMVELFEKM